MTNYFGVSDELLTDDGFLLLGSKPQVEYAVGLINYFKGYYKEFSEFDFGETKKEIVRLCTQDILEEISILATAKEIIDMLNMLPGNNEAYSPILTLAIKADSIIYSDNILIKNSEFMINFHYIPSISKFCETQNNSPNYKKTKGKAKKIETVPTNLTPEQLHESYCKWLKEHKYPSLTYENALKVHDLLDYKNKIQDRNSKITEIKKLDPNWFGY